LDLNNAHHFTLLQDSSLGLPLIQVVVLHIVSHNRCGLCEWRLNRRKWTYEESDWILRKVFEKNKDGCLISNRLGPNCPLPNLRQSSGSISGFSDASFANVDDLPLSTSETTLLLKVLVPSKIWLC